MLNRPAGEPASFVSPEQFESLLASVRPSGGNPRAGIFGPQSIAWKVNRESAVFLGAGRAALLQLAHPWVTAALAEHSTTLEDPIGRFHHTFRVVYTMVFGSRGQAIAAARRLYALHCRIRGPMTRSVAAYTEGSPYEANELRALRWVYATLIESAVLAYEFALGPLSKAERELYYTENKRMAALFGLPAEELPENWAAFEEYNRRMWASNLLGVDEKARSMAHQLLRGSGSWVVPPRWYRALTAWWMPERFREEFALPFGPTEERALARARKWTPAIYARLPKAIRWVGPYREALLRMNGRPRPGWTIRANTRFWTGQPRLMHPQQIDDPGDAPPSRNP